MLSWLTENAIAARNRLTTEVKKFRNQEFMEAVVAGCALVAASDGNVSADEKKKMAGFIQNSDELRVFDMTQVIGAFNRAIEKFEFDEEIGRAEALRAIAKIGKKPDAARLLVRVCCAIGSADGSFDEKEQAVCRQICRELGLTPADFDL